MIESYVTPYRDQYRRDQRDFWLPVEGIPLRGFSKNSIYILLCAPTALPYPGPNLGHAMYWTVVEQIYSKTAELTAIYISD